MIVAEELERYRPQHFVGLQRLQYASFDPDYSRRITTLYTGARAAGIRFERKVHGSLSAIFSPDNGPVLYAPAMWIRYVDGRRPHYAQPDGLLIDLKRSLITIIEIKLKHTIHAYFWLRELYEPLIRRIFGHTWKYAVCEVVKWFDGSTYWPEPLRMVADPSRLIANEFGLHICRI